MKAGWRKLLDFNWDELVDTLYAEMLAVNEVSPYSHREYERVRRMYEGALALLCKGELDVIRLVDSMKIDSAEPVRYYTDRFGYNEAREHFTSA